MDKLNVIMYHYVRDLQNSRYPNIKGLDYLIFKQQVQYLKQNYTIITMEELIASITESYSLPKNALLLTFDDGYTDHFMNVFPILKDADIQGSFFIPGKTFSEDELLDVNKIHFILASYDVTLLLPMVMQQLDYYRGETYQYADNTELFSKYAIANRFDSAEIIFIKRILQTVLPEELRKIVTSNLFKICVGISEQKFAKELYMNYDQIKCMKNSGMYIGLHGYDHYWLENLEENKMKEDIIKSFESLDGIVDESAWTIAYPYGSKNDKVISCVANMGCKAAFTTEVKKAEICEKNRFEIPRMDTNDFPPKSNNYMKIK